MPVYLVRVGEHGPVKIGKADDPAARLSELQVANHEKLHLLRVWEGGRAEEAALHARFADLHIRGDWYSFSRLMLRGEGLVEVLAEAPKPVVKKVIVPAPKRHDPLLEEVEKFIAANGTAATAFGQDVLGDPTFVHELRKGRECRQAVRAKVVAFIAGRTEAA